MPLTELMNYFNDQLQTQSKLYSLPKNGFFKLADGFGARFGNLILSADFQKIIYRNEYLYAFYGDLSIRSVAGNKLNIHDVFNSLDSREQIVHLDRLSRTLLSLNFLQQHDQSPAKLILPVHPRHIASVQGDHGRIFEIILEDCGLGPNRVSLYTQLDGIQDAEHFRYALLNYREKGYLISLEIHSPDEIAQLKTYGNTIDFVLTGHKFLKNLQDIKNKGELSDKVSLILKDFTSKDHQYQKDTVEFVIQKSDLTVKNIAIDKKFSLS